MSSFTIPPRTIAAGVQTFGPFATTGQWSHIDLTLDIANLTLMNTLVEFSEDGGATWRTLVQETGLGPSINPFTGLPQMYHLTADWSPPLPIGSIRLMIDNAVAFASAGGTLAVT